MTERILAFLTLLLVIALILWGEPRPQKPSREDDTSRPITLPAQDPADLPPDDLPPAGVVPLIVRP